MKELSIEEKAKRYDEAIEIAKGINNEQRAQPFNVMTRVFPELIEFEDESIRKVLVDYFKRYKEQEECGIKTFYGIPTDNIIAWLEKQGEQKSDEWSKEDEVKINRIVACLENLNVADNDILLKDVNWLKSLKGRVQPQPRQEWGEEDKETLDRIISNYQYFCKELFFKEGLTEVEKEVINNVDKEDIDWLKSLKERYTWKPSDEHYELEEFAKIVRRNLTGISKAV